MPYVTQAARDRLKMGGTPESVGELNYIITMALKPLYPRIMGYVMLQVDILGRQRYSIWNDVFGAMFGACLEFIRRMFPMYGVYENEQCRKSGDVYQDWREP